MANTKIKFTYEDRDAMSAGVSVLAKAYWFFCGGKASKIECVERAMRPFRTKYRLPGDEAMRDALTDVIRQMDEDKLMEISGDRNTARTWVINEALKVLGIKEPEPEKEEPEAEEQIPGQICMELPEAEPKKAEEPLDVAPIMRLIAGKAGELLKAIEMLHNDLTRIDDHMCQVLRRLVG